MILSPSERDTLEQMVRSSFDDKSINVYQAEKIVNLALKMPLSKDFKREILSDFQLSKNEYPIF